MADGGKGSSPRPLSVPKEEFETRWDAIFNKSKPKQSKADSDAYILACHTLWIAFIWNDHNFDDAHLCAQETAKKLGINNLDEANAWLERNKVTHE